MTCSVTDAASFAGMPAEPGAPSSGWTRTSCASSSAGGSPRGRESSWNSVYVTPLLTNPSGPRGANNEPLSPIEGSPGVVPTAKEESALLSASVATGTLVVSAVGVGILSFPHALATSRVPAFALSMVMVDLAAAAGLAVMEPMRTLPMPRWPLALLRVAHRPVQQRQRPALCGMLWVWSRTRPVALAVPSTVSGAPTTLTTVAAFSHYALVRSARL